MGFCANANTNTDGALGGRLPWQGGYPQGGREASNYKEAQENYKFTDPLKPVILG